MGKKTHGGPFVRSAMQDARIERLDDRGLVALAEARSTVRAAVAFRQGDARMVRGTSVTDADRLWAALLSLDHADDFVREATRLRWEFHVRGRDNLALVERYGDGILPWLESRLDGRGVLVNVPWCVVPSLLALGTREAFALALRTRAVHDLLPGQAPLGGGPGVFAADRQGTVEGEPEVDGPEHAVGFAGDTRGFDLARSWIAKHPEGTFFALESARAGDARARALLAEMASDVGSAVLDVIEARLGRDAARAIFGELSLPLPTLPPEVQAALDEAEVADVGRGPVLGMDALDAAARQYEFPLWDNANVAVTASRVRGFVSPRGDVLTIETFGFHPGSGEPPSWTCTTFGSRPTRAVADQAVLSEDDVATTWIDDEKGHLVDGYANLLRIEGHAVRDPFEGELVVHVVQPLSGSEGEDVSFPAGLPEDFRAPPPQARPDLDPEVQRISAGEAAMVQVGRRRPDLLFPASADLAKALGIADAELLFEHDLVAWPAAGDPASSSLDLLTLVTALRQRRRVARLPNLPEAAVSTPLRWLPACASLRFFDGPDPWPEGDPFALPLPDDGPGATPVDSRLLLRGWPHGASLVHADAYNAEGLGRGVMAHSLTPGGARWLMSSRVGACAFVRAAGAVRGTWTIDDPGIAEAITDESLVTPDEARSIVARFVAGPPASLPRIGAELVFLLEALVGPSVTIEAFAAALAAAPAARWSDDATAIGAALFELGVLLRRTRAPREPLRAMLAKSHASATHPEVQRALDLVLHGRAGAERSARCEGDYLHVDDDRAWARERILDPRTPPSVEDVALFPIAGDGLIDKYAARVDRLVDRAWLALQLPRIGSPKAAALLARLSG